MVFQAPSKPITLDEFLAFALRPENAERNVETSASSSPKSILYHFLFTIYIYFRIRV
jgi:hypothetical protein